jgi:hypothetical protein
MVVGSGPWITSISAVDAIADCGIIKIVGGMMSFH